MQINAIRMGVLFGIISFVIFLIVFYTVYALYTYFVPSVADGPVLACYDGEFENESQAVIFSFVDNFGTFSPSSLLRSKSVDGKYIFCFYRDRKYSTIIPIGHEEAVAENESTFKVHPNFSVKFPSNYSLIPIGGTQYCYNIIKSPATAMS